MVQTEPNEAFLWLCALSCRCR